MYVNIIYIVTACILWLCPQYPANPVSEHHNLLKRTRRSSSILDPDGLFQGDIILSRRQKLLLERYGYGRHGIYKRDTEAVSSNRRKTPLNNTNNYTNDGEVPKDRLKKHSPILSRNSRNAMRDSGLSTKWPNGIVNYYFVPQKFTGDERRKFRIAMNILESVSCVKFREKFIHNEHTLKIDRDDEHEKCSANTGYDPYETMRLMASTKCLTNTSNIVHELLHVLGFWHMHSHPNRDYYITIHRELIKPGLLKDFNKMPRHLVTDFGVPYDCSSIMHYGPTVGSKLRYTKTVTIEVKENHKRTCILGENHLTEKDKCKLNRMYQCPYKCNILKYRTSRTRY